MHVGNGGSTRWCAGDDDGLRLGSQPVLKIWEVTTSETHKRNQWHDDERSQPTVGAVNAALCLPREADDVCRLGTHRDRLLSGDRHDRGAEEDLRSETDHILITDSQEQAGTR